LIFAVMGKRNTDSTICTNSKYDIITMCFYE
jgi:hypothetical protein